MLPLGGVDQPEQLAEKYDFPDILLDSERCLGNRELVFAYQVLEFNKLTLHSFRMPGSIPSKFGKLKNLTHLHLKWNSLEGDEP